MGDRLIVTRVVQSPSGSETVIGHKESVLPMSNEEVPEVTEDIDEYGNRVHRHFHQTSTIKTKTIINITVHQKPDGTEEEVEQSVEIIPEEQIPLECLPNEITPLQESTTED